MPRRVTVMNSPAGVSRKRYFAVGRPVDTLQEPMGAPFFQTVSVWVALSMTRP